MEKTIVRCDEAPSPVGPYSQGVIADGWIWTSGQVALDPASAAMTGADAPEQADRALRNIEAILRAAGSSLEQVVRRLLDEHGRLRGRQQGVRAVFPGRFPGAIVRGGVTAAAGGACGNRRAGEGFLLK
jgi:Endoribonuclease L-PSP